MSTAASLIGAVPLRAVHPLAGRALQTRERDKSALALLWDQVAAPISTGRQRLDNSSAQVRTARVPARSPRRLVSGPEALRKQLSLLSNVRVSRQLWRAVESPRCHWAALALRVRHILPNWKDPST